MMASGVRNALPISNQTLCLQNAKVTHRIRQLILCKDKDGKVGLRVEAVDNGIFVTLVIGKSPAALAGLRFGDQILEINGTSVAGFTMEKVHTLLKQSPVNGISVVVRDRPFERTITLHKDNSGLLGLQFKDGKITICMMDSSASRNGVLIDHQLLEINGQNVVGVTDKEVAKIIYGCQGLVTVTIMPSFGMIMRMDGHGRPQLVFSGSGVTKPGAPPRQLIGRANCRSLTTLTAKGASRPLAPPGLLRPPRTAGLRGCYLRHCSQGWPGL